MFANKLQLYLSNLPSLSYSRSWSPNGREFIASYSIGDVFVFPFNSCRTDDTAELRLSLRNLQEQARTSALLDNAARSIERNNKETAEVEMNGSRVKKMSGNRSSGVAAVPRKCRDVSRSNGRSTEGIKKEGKENKEASARLIGSSEVGICAEQKNLCSDIEVVG